MVDDESRQRTRRGAPLRIAHLFADVGVESEALSLFGDVHRYTIDPQPSPFNASVTQMDLEEDAPAPDEPFDLALLQPPCYRWTQRDAEDAENLIPRARELAEKIAEDYVIENKPDAPLRAPQGGSKVTLHGGMFGLPVEYARTIEASYHVPRPKAPREWSPEHRVENTRPYQYWKAVKGYRGDYPAKEYITNALPAPYVRWIVRPLLDGYQWTPSAQTELTEVGNRV
jgi:hypothetical protein